MTSAPTSNRAVDVRFLPLPEVPPAHLEIRAWPLVPLGTQRPQPSPYSSFPLKAPEVKEQEQGGVRSQRRRQLHTNKQRLAFTFIFKHPPCSSKKLLRFSTHLKLQPQHRHHVSISEDSWTQQPQPHGRSAMCNNGAECAITHVPFRQLVSTLLSAKPVNIDRKNRRTLTPSPYSPCPRPG